MILLWLWCLVAFAGPLSDGADAFEAGDLDAAVEVMRPVAEDGWASGRLHYNLGNAYYRKGEIPRAILHYRNAQLRRPRDGNVHHNLALARSELAGLPPPVGLPYGWMALMTTGELGLLGILLTGSGSAVAIWWRRRRDRPPGAWIPAALLVLVGLGVSLAAGAAVWTHGAQGIAVVVDGEALARDAARSDGGERFRLPPGAEVVPVRKVGEFVLIEDGDHRRGWVPISTVAITH